MAGDHLGGLRGERRLDPSGSDDAPMRTLPSLRSAAIRSSRDVRVDLVLVLPEMHRDRLERPLVGALGLVKLCETQPCVGISRPGPHRLAILGNRSIEIAGALGGDGRVVARHALIRPQPQARLEVLQRLRGLLLLERHEPADDLGVRLRELLRPLPGPGRSGQPGAAPLRTRTDIGPGLIDPLHHLLPGGDRRRVVADLEVVAGQPSPCLEGRCGLELGSFQQERLRFLRLAVFAKAPRQQLPAPRVRRLHCRAPRAGSRSSDRCAARSSKNRERRVDDDGLVGNVFEALLEALLGELRGRRFSFAKVARAAQ